MTAEPLTHDLGYFQRLYAAHHDPWRFDSSAYEQRKYALTCAALPAARFRRALEPGCANGALTERLAARCAELIAFDAIEAVVRRAADRLAGAPHVQIRCARFPQFWPPGSGDLVVWSEICYYLTDAGQRVALAGLARWLEPGGTLLTVHYTGRTDYPRSGASIGAWLDASGLLRRSTTVHDERFDLIVWRRAGVTGQA